MSISKAFYGLQQTLQVVENGFEFCSVYLTDYKVDIETAP